MEVFRRSLLVPTPPGGYEFTSRLPEDVLLVIQDHLQEEGKKIDEDFQGWTKLLNDSDGRTKHDICAKKQRNSENKMMPATSLTQREYVLGSFLVSFFAIC